MQETFLYKAVVRVDMLDPKQKTIQKLNSFALIAIMLCCTVGIILNYCLRMLGQPGGMYLVYILCGIVNCLIYIYFHEFAHAVVISVIKRRKPEIKFGKLAASCGLPSVAFTKPQYAVSALAPFIIYSLILIPLCVLVPPEFFVLPFMPLVYNVFGSIGDMYMLRRMLKTPRRCVIVDDGTCVSAYRPDYSAASN